VVVRLALLRAKGLAKHAPLRNPDIKRSPVRHAAAQDPSDRVRHAAPANLMDGPRQVQGAGQTLDRAGEWMGTIPGFGPCLACSEDPWE
jgi:hypothetical protein